MALSMDEQRILEEIERRLAEEDPRLAARLTSFGHPGLAMTLRSRRGRMLASLVALVTLAVISVAVYLVVPLSTRHPARPRPAPAASQPTLTSPGGTSQPVFNTHNPGSSAPTSASPAHSTRGAAADRGGSRSATNSVR